MFTKWIDRVFESPKRTTGHLRCVMGARRIWRGPRRIARGHPGSCLRMIDPSHRHPGLDPGSRFYCLRLRKKRDPGSWRGDNRCGYGPGSLPLPAGRWSSAAIMFTSASPEPIVPRRRRRGRPSQIFQDGTGGLRTAAPPRPASDSVRARGDGHGADLVDLFAQRRPSQVGIDALEAFALQRRGHFGGACTSARSGQFKGSLDC